MSAVAMSALCQKQTFPACSDHRSRNQAFRFTILPRGAVDRGKIAKLPACYARKADTGIRLSELFVPR
jgi:hypothetical protein